MHVLFDLFLFSPLDFFFLFFVCFFGCCVFICLIFIFVSSNFSFFFFVFFSSIFTAFFLFSFLFSCFHFFFLIFQKGKPVLADIQNNQSLIPVVRFSTGDELINLCQSNNLAISKEEIKMDESSSE